MMRISENIRTSFNQDGAVLMDIQGGSMLTLNPIGSIIWRQLSDGRSPERIAEHLALEFGISQERALTDVNEFVEQLQAQHLLESSERQDFRVNLGPKPTGLFCDLLRRRNSHERQDDGSMKE